MPSMSLSGAIVLSSGTAYPASGTGTIVGGTGTPATFKYTANASSGYTVGIKTISLLLGNTYSNGCTINITSVNTSGAITAITLGSGGTGTNYYAVGDILGIAGGIGGIATVTTTDGSGHVTGVTLTNVTDIELTYAGDYTVLPPTTATTTGGGNNDLTLSLMQAPIPPTTFSVPYLLPTGGTTWNPTTTAELKTALANSVPGDVIVLQAGTVYSGNFKAPAKSNPNGKWIYVISSDLASLPQGSRVDYNDGLHMPVLQNTAANGVALFVDASADHWRFAGIEFTTNISCYPIVATGYVGDTSHGPTSLSQLPSWIVFDRCWINSPENIFNVTGIGLNGLYMTVINCRIEGAKGQADSQAILTFNGPGPYLIDNNYLEGTSQCVMFGGDDCYSIDFLPSDIVFSNNLCTKRLAWNPYDPSYDNISNGGVGWKNSIKNAFEIKNAKRVWLHNNVFENVWYNTAGQSATGVVFTVRNQGGSNPYAQISDILFENNTIQHVGVGLRITGEDDNHVSAQTQRVIIRNNVFRDLNSVYIGGSNPFALMASTSTLPILDLVIDNNITLFGPDPTTSHGAAFFYLNGTNPCCQNFLLKNNIFEHGQYGLAGTSLSAGLPSLLHFTNGFTMVGNVIIGRPAVDNSYPTTLTQSWLDLNYPHGNYLASGITLVGFADLSSGNYRLVKNTTYKGLGSDGNDPGPNYASLQIPIQYPIPHRTWIKHGSCAYQSSTSMCSPTATINTAGSGYTNGDIVYLPSFTTVANIPVSGYPYPNPASFRITVVNGTVTKAALNDSGNYPWNGGGQKLPGMGVPTGSLPSYKSGVSTGVPVTGGTGNGLILNINWWNGGGYSSLPSGNTLNNGARWYAENMDWLNSPGGGLVPLYQQISDAPLTLYFNYYNQYMATAEMISWCDNHLTATIVNAGSGYLNNDVVTLVGGTLNPIPNELTGGSVKPSTFMLTVNENGVVTDATLLIAAKYATLPSNPVSVTGGTGAGLTLHLVSDGGVGQLDPETMFLHYYAPTTVTLSSDVNGINYTANMPGVGGKYPTCILGTSTPEPWTGLLEIMPFDSTGKTIKWYSNGWGGYQFAKHDIGTQIIITGGTGFTAGTYTIESVVRQYGYDSQGSFHAIGYAVVDRSMGTPGSKGGTGSITLSAPMGGIVPTYYWIPQPGVTCLSGSRVMNNLNNPYYRLWTSVNYTWHIIKAGYTGAYLDQMNMNGATQSWQPAAGGTITLSDMQAFTEYPTGKVSSSGVWTHSGTAWTLKDTTQSWAANEWQNCTIRDAAGNNYKVSSNAVNTLAVNNPSTNPTSGIYNLGGVLAGAILWNYDMLDCYKLNSERYFSENFKFFSNWYAGVSYPTLPYVTHIFWEFGVYYLSGLSVGNIEMYASAQMSGKPNAPSWLACYDDNPPTGQICYPGYAHLNTLVGQLARYYIVFNYNDIFVAQESTGNAPLPFDDIGMLNYNIGAPISSGKTPIVQVSGPTSCYIFATTVDGASSQIDSGTGNWTGPNSSGAYTLTDTTKNWITNQWYNCNVIDGAGNNFGIAANTAQTITVASWDYKTVTPSNGTTNQYQLSSRICSLYARNYQNALTFYRPHGYGQTFGISIASASIANPGSGYTDLDVVTVQDSSNNLPGATAQFQVAVVGGNVVGLYPWSLSVSIVNGGSGITNASGIYQINGGTYHTAAQLTLTISGGVVTAASISTNGIYSVLPTNPVTVSGLTATTQPTFNFVSRLIWNSRVGIYETVPTNPVTMTGGSGTGLKLNLVPIQKAVSATVNTPGSGYLNGDIVTVVGGILANNPSYTAATFILEVSGGVITRMAATNTSGYSQFPSNPVSVTGGHGTGLKLNLVSGIPSELTTYTLPTSPTGNWYYLNADFNGTVSNTTPLTSLKLVNGQGAILVTSTTSPAVSASMTTFPYAVPSNHSGNISLAVSGTGTNWKQSTTFSVSGVSGVTLVSHSVQSATEATVIITTGSGTGILTLTDGAISYPITVIAPTITAVYNPLSRLSSDGESIALSANAAVWAQENLAHLFSITVGTGSLATPINVTNCYCWIKLTASTPVTITDNSTGATTTFTLPTKLNSNQGIGSAIANSVAAATSVSGNHGVGVGSAIANSVAAATGTSIISFIAGQNVTISGMSSGGYNVGDILDLVGGTYTTQAQVQVTSVNGGIVTGVSIYNAGAYSASPSNPISTTASIGSGSGCKIGVNWTYTYTFNPYTKTKHVAYAQPVSSQYDGNFSLTSVPSDTSFTYSTFPSNSSTEGNLGLPSPVNATVMLAGAETVTGVTDENGFAQLVLTQNEFYSQGIHPWGSGTTNYTPHTVSVTYLGITAAATVTMTGSQDLTLQLDTSAILFYTGSGVITFSGSAIAFLSSYRYKGSGRITLKGSATAAITRRNYIYRGSGKVNIEGSAWAEITFKHYLYTGTGTLTIGGSTQDTDTILYFASGIIYVVGQSNVIIIPPCPRASFCQDQCVPIKFVQGGMVPAITICDLAQEKPSKEEEHHHHHHYGRRRRHHRL